MTATTPCVCCTLCGTALQCSRIITRDRCYCLCLLILQTSHKKRWCLYICQKKLQYSIIDLDKYCKDQDIEVCVLKLESTFFNVCIIAVYRAPTGNFNLFLNRLDDIIKTLYKANLQLIICGDINTHYLTANDKKKGNMMLCF